MPKPKKVKKEEVKKIEYPFELNTQKALPPAPATVVGELYNGMRIIRH